MTACQPRRSNERLPRPAAWPACPANTGPPSSRSTCATAAGSRRGMVDIDGADARVGTVTAGNNTRPAKSQTINIAVVLPTSTGTATNCRSGTSAILAVHNLDRSTVHKGHLRAEDHTGLAPGHRSCPPLVPLDQLQTAEPRRSHISGSCRLVRRWRSGPAAAGSAAAGSGSAAWSALALAPLRRGYRRRVRVSRPAVGTRPARASPRTGLRTGLGLLRRRPSRPTRSAWTPANAAHRAAGSPWRPTPARWPAPALPASPVRPPRGCGGKAGGWVALPGPARRPAPQRCHRPGPRSSRLPRPSRRRSGTARPGSSPSLCRLGRVLEVDSMT